MTSETISAESDANAGDENQNSDSPTDASAAIRRPRMAPTAGLPEPTEYVKALDGEYAAHAFNEDRAAALKGKWRAEAFKVGADHPLDLEIGTGNGYHFAHMSLAMPERSVLGIELKFKPLIQSIRRALAAGAKNCAIARYDAFHLDHLFEKNELNNVYIHFPDPWSKKRQWKHRLIQAEFLETLYALMKPGSFVDFKTDNLDYFEWAAERFHASPFKVTRETRDLHKSEWAAENFVTHFESIFLAQKMQINYARLEKV